MKIRVGKENSRSGSGIEQEHLFEDPMYISVPEDTPVGTNIHDIEPVDKNSFNTKNMFNFELFDQMPYNAFELSKNPRTFKTSIKLIRSLDYEQDQQYVMTLRVTASDGENDKKRMTKQPDHSVAFC